MAKILLIDDEKVFRLSTKDLLESWEHTVFEAACGKEVLEILPRQDVDLVLLDLHLPDISGEELLPRILNLNPDLPVIIVTAYAAVDSAVQTLRQGAYDYLLKPLQEDALRRSLAKALEKAALQKENKELWSTLRRKIQELSLLNELGKTLSSTMDLRELLPLFMEKTQALVNAEASSLLLYDEKSQELYFNVALGEKSSQVKELRLKMGEGVAGWVALHGQPLLVADARTDPRFASRVDAITQFDTRSILCVPLQLRGKTLGVVEFINRRDGQPFDQADLELMNSTASLASVAIENAHLYEEVVEYSRSLESKVQQKVEELQQAQNQLVKNERAAALGRLAAGVAHDLNSPLAGLKNYLYIMGQDLDPQHPHQTHLRMMETAIERLSQVSRDLVEFSLPPEKRNVRTNINLHKVIDSAFLLLGKYLRDKQCRVIKEFYSQELQIRANWGEVLQVILSLVMEALDSQTESDQIKVVTGKEDQSDAGSRIWLQMEFARSGISQEASWRIKEILKILQELGGEMMLGNPLPEGRSYSRSTFFFPRMS